MVVGYAQYQGPFGQEYRNLLYGKPYATVNLPGIAIVVYKVHGMSGQLRHCVEW